MCKDDLLNYCTRHKRIFCYGAGRYGREVRVFLQEQGIDIEGFIVSERDTDVEKILGKKIVAFESIISDVLQDENIGVLVTVGGRYSNEPSCCEV